LPAGALERVHLAVQHRAALLHAAIVPTPQDAAFVHEHRTDGNAALVEPVLGLLDCRANELVHGR
jgi:hypothetical protein